MPENNQPQIYKTHSGSNRFFYIIIFVLSLLAIIFGYLSNINKSSKDGINKVDNKVSNIEKGIEEIKKDLAPSSYIKSLQKSVIITNFKNSTQNNSPTQSFSKKLKINGELSEAYLYVTASVNGKPLSDNDDIYIKISGNKEGVYNEFGGHLIKEKSLEMQTLTDRSEFIYNMNNVGYKSNYLNSNRETVSGDWLLVMNGGQINLILGFISTIGEGQIKELSIYYKCQEGSDKCFILPE